MSCTVSIITAVYNGTATIRDCLESVASQSHPAEHIVIDGGSTDDTLKIVSEFPHVARVISEPDKGIYDAMNKGIALATGDIVGVLNADDVFADRTVLERIVAEFAVESIDACYSDLVYVDRKDTGSIVRYWKSCDYEDGLFRTGWIPPHPTFYMKRSAYERFGAFDLRYRIASDYEMMMRCIVKHHIRVKYLPLITVKMRTGGTSNKSLGNIIRQNIEIYEAARRNGIRLAPFFFLHKLRTKLSQFYRRPV